jgi:hypothetical protein
MTAARRVALIGGAVVAVAIAVTAFLLVGVRSSHPQAPAGTPVADPIVQVPGLPEGATACPQVYTDPTASFEHGARGTPMTSCPFVEQVRLAYAKQSNPNGPEQLRVASPATGKWYDLVCIPTADYVTCSGGVVAVIYLYNR